MKIKFLLFLFIAISSSPILSAQITKGDIFRGGQIGIGSFKVDGNSLQDYKQTSLIISPALGLVTKNNLVVGFDLPVIFFKDETGDPNGIDRKDLSIGAGVFARKYFEIANRFYLFAQGRFGTWYSSNYVKYSERKLEDKGYGVNISLYPGLSYALKKNIHLESGFYNLAYMNWYHKKITSSYPGETDRKENGFSINAFANGQTAFTIGIRFFLPGKNKS